MKHYIALLGLCGLFGVSATAAPVVDKRHWTESFDVGDRPTLTVNNIWGDVTVTRGESNQIEMTIESERRADNQRYFDRSLEMIPLKIEQSGDDVSFVVGQRRNWQNAPRCNGCRLYINLVVTVPRNITLDVATVNDGDVVINGITGRIAASNVNGAVSSRGLTACEELTTVNGDIDVQFVDNPGADCRIETLNGDIDLTLAPNSNVNFALELSNGKMRSALELTPLAVPAAVEHEVRDGRHYYDISQYAGLQLGRGGHLLTVKTFNGDVAVARNQ